MIEVYDSKDITLEICQEIKKLAKEAKACKASYVPFVKALNGNNLKECVAIINGETEWLKEFGILPYKFVRNGHTVNYYDNGKIYEEFTFVNNKIVGEFSCYYDNGQKYIQSSFNENGFLHGDYKVWDRSGIVLQELIYDNGDEA